MELVSPSIYRPSSLYRQSTLLPAGMAYILPIHKASGIRDSTIVNFFDKDITVLAVVKSLRLELYNITAEGLSLAYQHHIYGQITTLQRVQDDPAEAEKLLITTDRRRCMILRWDTEQKRIFEDVANSVIDTSTRPMPYAERVHMAPNGSFVLLELSPGMLTVIPFEVPVSEKRRKGSRGKKTMRDPSLLRIEQFSIKSATFIDTEMETFVILWEDGLERVHLISYDLEKKPTSTGIAVERKHGGITRQNVPRDAQLLIPVPHTEGVMMVAETSITFLDRTDADVYYQLPSPTVWLHWTAVDNHTYLLADDFNRLWMLKLSFTHQRPEGMEIRIIGETSKATRLTYLGGRKLFVGSHQGDSQLLLLRDDFSGFEVLQILENLAPILDFSIMDLGGGGGGGGSEGMSEYSSGQVRIVAGCGAFKTGSLRTIRSGVALDDVVKIGDILGIDDVFSLCCHSEMKVDCLVISLVGETRVFVTASEGVIEEVEEFANFQMDQSTLLAMTASVPSGILLLQITPRSVRLSRSDGEPSVDWSPQEADSTITLAAANEEIIIVCVDGKLLLAFDWSGSLKARSQRQVDREASCLTVPGDDIGIEPGIAIIGFFEDSALHVLGEHLQTVRELPLQKSDGLSIPQSLLSAQILDLQKPTLLVGMSDGTVLTGHIEKETYFATAQKEIVLGSQYPRFKLIPRRDGLNSVFVNCTHPTLIYGQDKRLVFSAITGEEDPVCMSSFVSSPETEDFVAVVTRTELKVAHVQPQRSTQIRSLHMGETVRRIAYSSQNRAFVLGTVKQDLVEDEERLDSSLKLVDDIAFEELHSVSLGDNELVEAVIVTKLSHLRTEDVVAEEKEIIVVGTSLVYADKEPTTIKGGNQDADYRGRLMVYQVDSQTRKLQQMCAMFLKGECRCLAMAGNMIVAGLSKTILLFNVESQGSETVLKKRASCRLSTAPISLVVQGDRIAVADLMKSAAILEIRPKKSDGTIELVEVARHYQTVWTTAIQSVQPDTYLQSDSEGNLLLLKENRNQDALAAHERRQLEVLAEFHLSEMVNRIQPLDVPEPPPDGAGTSAVWPRAILATVEGSLYLFGLLGPSWTAPLLELQRVMGDDDDGGRFGQAGWVDFAEFRAFASSVRTAAEPFRCVDGEFVQQFLDVSEDVQEGLAEVVGERMMLGQRRVTGKGLRDLLGQLRRLQ